MYDRFKELGIPVELTRTSDVSLSSDNRPKVALSKYGNGDNVIVISNHINAGGGEGAEVIYALRDKDTLASKILNNIAEKGQVIRKYYQRRLPSDTSKDYYYMLRNTPDTEAIIVEYGFLDNVNDANRLKQNYKAYADAVIDAVLEYKGLLSNNGDYYIVKKGDSLWSISSKFGVNVYELKNLNNLNSNNLSIGQKLLIPRKNVVEESKPSGNTYTVKSGDTLYSIANKYGITVDELKSTNNLSSNTLSLNQVLKIPGLDIDIPNTYTVKKGDSLYSIANKFGTTVNDIKSLNKLSNNTLSIGQVLLLPGVVNENVANTYTVKSGDTLYSIANKYNISVNELKSINNLSSNNLSIGQTLKLRNNSNDFITEELDYYTVKNGDTLYSIANKLNISVDELKNLNGLDNNILSVGALLLIPNNSNNVYVVKKGDTLWSIAKDYNTSVDKLKNMNNLVGNSLSIGQQLLIN